MILSLLVLSNPLPHLWGLDYFFVTKKVSSLRPCIDFHALNNVTIKYPLPLIEHVINQGLKNCWGICEAERIDQIFKMAE